MRIVGIDYSLTCPCACVLAEDRTFANSTSHFLTDKKKVTGQFGNVYGELHKPWDNFIHRYVNIASQIFTLANIRDDDIIVIEDYSLGSSGKVFNIAENCAILKHLLYQKGVTFYVIAPTTVKKQFTGKGNSDKNQMYRFFREKTSVDLYEQLHLKQSLNVVSPISDIVDSYALAVGYAKYGSL